MDNPQYYQPLSHALHPPLVATNYSSYGSHAQTTTNGTAHTNREEEEEEEDDEEEVVEEELEQNELDQPQHPPTSQAAAARTTASTVSTAPTTQGQKQDIILQVQPQHVTAEGDDATKRKPGRPRGSRNRKPRASINTSAGTKAPANSQHPGFYQYPPAPGGTLNPNQQFYEFQWRALNLCSEFYNAAEELVKAASPIVIAQCYQMGPATRVDPLAMIADAKRVCDGLLANPSQLVGQPPPPSYSYPSSYPSYPPPAAPSSSTAPSASPPASGSVITNPQSFVMPLSSSSMPPPTHAAPNPYYSGVYATARYPTAPYYSYPAQPANSYYAPPSASAPAGTTAPPPTTTPAPATASPTTAAGIGYNSTPATAAPISAPGQQGSWSPDEEDRLRKLSEQSREMGVSQNKGEIEWDWVVQQWGNTRTRHQILLKATSLGLKESTTRATKRKRDTDAGASETNDHAPTPASHTGTNAMASAPSTSTISPVQTHPTHAQPTHSQSLHTQPAHSQTTITPAPTTTTPVSSNASPALPPQRPPSSTTTPATVAPVRSNATTSPATSSSMPWPMPTVAANTPSPVLAAAQVEQRATSYYRPTPTQRPSYGTSAGASTTTSYAAASASNTSAYGAAATSRPTSSHGSAATASHPYMYRPSVNGTGRRDGADSNGRDPPLPFRMQPSK